MDCLEFRRALDLYVDGELSPEAAASASVHGSECASCKRTEQELRRLRQAVKDAVLQLHPPAGLAGRIQQSLSPSKSRVGIAAIAAAVLLFLSMAALSGMPGVRASLADRMEEVAFHLDQPRTPVLEGEIVCRECELFAQYGFPVERDVQGHHGGLKTAEGKIWDFMESRASEPLIHDESLLGKRVRIYARLYRRASCLEVINYQVLPST